MVWHRKNSKKCAFVEHQKTAADNQEIPAPAEEIASTGESLMAGTDEVCKRHEIVVSGEIVQSHGFNVIRWLIKAG